MSLVAEPQTTEERLGFPTPPDHQCPSIDYVINAIRTCEKYMKKYDRMDEEELKSAMWEIEREMFDLEKKMELIRSACEGIREWGQAWKDLCKRAADLRDLDLEDLEHLPQATDSTAPLSRRWRPNKGFCEKGETNMTLQFNETDINYFKKFWREIDLSKADLGPVKSDILAYLDELSTLQQQNKQLVEAVLDAEVHLKLDEDIPDDKELAYELGYKDALWNLSDAIRSLQGGTDNENAQS